jgi:protein-tyrosine phosphatase
LPRAKNCGGEGFMTDSSGRVIALAGVHNFRDYGGYAVAGGGRLRRGVLWRSGQHHSATEADLAQIAELQLAAIFDLRSDVERASHPCRRPKGFAGEVFIVADAEAQTAASASAAPHVAAAQTARGRDAAAMRAILERSYTTIPFRATLVASMRSYLAALAQDGRPSLINCMAGKDRTGVAVALLHRAVGVHRDDVMADYLLTNTAGDSESRIAAGGAVAQLRSGEMSPEAMRVLMGVEPEYLHTAFATIAERHGSEDAYLAEVLGADAALRDRLRDQLVEG